MPPPRRRPPSKSVARSQVFARRFIALMIFLAGAGLAWLAWMWWRTEDLRSVHYPEFGITIPAQYPIHGIDVSRYQQGISWKAVREMNSDGIRLGFAFIKATEGVSSVDPYFRRNWKRSRDAGIVRGAYHFFLPARSGRIQAEHFIKTVALAPGDLPPVVDIENAGGRSPAAVRKELKAWLDITEQYYGVRPIIYTYLSFYNNYLAGHFDEYPLWVAHYLQPERPRTTRQWAFWQHSESGRVNGILSKVDFNVFSGDSAAFRALLVP
ncbi:glycoside hydrolase family 25 protein [Flaviaesturariibacter amylovorans]|uniref:Glycoside hydrolase family 25 protein n=1 Tax=Flaviaesturariibacter amylovorans TaxID=1084520 RepID=A0ABP8HRT9_9BACT